jgi:predicted Ser/Thr protein kinase
VVGKTTSHYRILEKLGGGGMGVVYKAEDTVLGRLVALKFLPEELAQDHKFLERFQREARAASALNHPNIIVIHDIDEAEGVHFIAMEYVAGKTLDRLIARRGLRVNEALKYAVQMAAALAKAHAVGIVHRDLKPTNVMVTEDGLVKVLDFGLAKLTEAAPAADAETVATMEPRTEEGAIIGTVGYMSPEQAEGKPVDARSDIFSFGSVLYEMLTGQRAFQGETKASTIAAILRDEPKALSQVVEGLPREIERVVKRCLRKDREHRFQTMADLKVALEELKQESDSGELAEAAAVAPVYDQRRLSAVTDRPYSVGAAIVVLAVALGFGLGWALRPRPRRLGPVTPGGTETWLAGPDLSDLRIRHISEVALDPQSGEVRITLDAERRVTLKGSLDDPRIRQVLVDAVRGYYNPGIRRDTLEALRTRRDNPSVRAALLYAMRHDANAGVRLEALRTVQGMEPGRDVQEALLGALEHDTNQGVRVAAVNALIERAAEEGPDEAVMPVLVKLAANDPNAYVRLQCQAAVRKMEGNEQ